MFITTHLFHPLKRRILDPLREISIYIKPGVEIFAFLAGIYIADLAYRKYVVDIEQNREDAKQFERQVESERFDNTLQLITLFSSGAYLESRSSLHNYWDNRQRAETLDTLYTQLHASMPETIISFETFLLDEAKSGTKEIEHFEKISDFHRIINICIAQMYCIADVAYEAFGDESRKLRTLYTPYIRDRRKDEKYKTYAEGLDSFTNNYIRWLKIKAQNNNNT